MREGGKVEVGNKGWIQERNGVNEDGIKGKKD